METETLWIGRRVRVLRDRAGLTQVQLAKALGKSHKSVGRIERGEIIPGIETIIEITRILGINLEGFFTSEEDDPLLNDPHILMPVHRDDQKLIQTVIDHLNELRSKKG
jgi:transcriptional regulator with XRE-family HTH domain